MNSTEKLEEKIFFVFDGLHIKDKDREALMAFTAPLKFKSPITCEHYEHSLRVALIAVCIGSFIHMDKKPLLYSGLLHDIGKSQTDLKVLGKKKDWTSKDSKTMEKHVIDSYNIIRGRFEFTAEIVLWHHKFQKKGYPKNVNPLIDHSIGTKIMILLFGRMLALTDVYEALHRPDDKYGGPLTGEQIKEKMFELNEDQEVLINELYDAGIFTTDQEKFLEDPVGNWLEKVCR